MNYAWKVDLKRDTGYFGDKYSYTVAARSLRDAERKALKQAISDSGYKTKWVVISAVRGDWIVA